MPAVEVTLPYQHKLMLLYLFYTKIRVYGIFSLFIWFTSLNLYIQFKPTAIRYAAQITASMFLIFADPMVYIHET